MSVYIGLVIVGGVILFAVIFLKTLRAIEVHLAQIRGHLDAWDWNRRKRGVDSLPDSNPFKSLAQEVVEDRRPSDE